MHFLWTQGHFGWPLVAFVIWCTACLLATDFVWRTVRMRGVKLVCYSSAGWLLGAAAIAVGAAL